MLEVARSAGGSGTARRDESGDDSAGYGESHCAGVLTAGGVGGVPSEGGRAEASGRSGEDESTPPPSTQQRTYAPAWTGLGATQAAVNVMGRGSSDI